MREDIEIIVGDIHNESHASAMLEQLDLYMQDPMGDFGKLTSEFAAKIISGLRNQPNYLFFLARVGNKYAGLANCFVNFSTFKAKPFINIHDFAVDPAFRKKGIGQALMNFIFEYAREMEYCKVNLEVRYDNVGAQMLYQKTGFKECTPPMYFWEKHCSQI
ncbi:MAG: GNAT family N-acetyltransferase [Prolixibacteraceae bacterium]|nr:GNAT family N-acetyltransferase [Prolixibacteraceae bacterium]